jgi:hypothetical protein
MQVRLLPDHLPLLGSVAVMSWITKFLSKLIFIKVCWSSAVARFSHVQQLGVCVMVDTRVHSLTRHAS